MLLYTNRLLTTDQPTGGYRVQPRAICSLSRYDCPACPRAVHSRRILHAGCPVGCTRMHLLELLVVFVTTVDNYQRSAHKAIPHTHAYPSRAARKAAMVAMGLTRTFAAKGVIVHPPPPHDNATWCHSCTSVGGENTAKIVLQRHPEY